MTGELLEEETHNFFGMHIMMQKSTIMLSIPCIGHSSCGCSLSWVQTSVGVIDKMRTTLLTSITSSTHPHPTNDAALNEAVLGQELQEGVSTACIAIVDKTSAYMFTLVMQLAPSSCVCFTNHIHILQSYAGKVLNQIRNRPLSCRIISAII